MNAEQFQELLEHLNACREAREWAQGKDWETVFQTCHRGDWLLWLFSKTRDMKIESNLRTLTLAKAHCANTVKHLMKDERSLKALEVAFAFGEGRATREELDDAAAAAVAYADAAYAAYAAAAAYADAAAAAYADAAAAYAYAAYAAAAAARKENQALTADLCRQHLPFEIWNLSL